MVRRCRHRPASRNGAAETTGDEVILRRDDVAGFLCGLDDGVLVERLDRAYRSRGTEMPSLASPFAAEMDSATSEPVAMMVRSVPSRAVMALPTS